MVGFGGGITRGIGQEGAETLNPAFDRRGALPAAVVLAQLAQQHKPGGLGRLAGKIGRPGVHTLPQRIFALRQQPAQHAAFGGLLPSEGLAATAVIGAHFGIRAPVHVEFGHAAAQEFGVGFINLPMVAHRLGIE